MPAPTSPTAPARLLTTRSVPAAESLEYWHDAVLASLVGMDIRTDGHSYDAAMHNRTVGDLRISTLECDPADVRRSPRSIARGDGQYVFVALQSTGIAQVEQDGRTDELRAGDIGFFETIRPFRSRYPERFRLKLFTLPRALLCQDEGDLRRLTARPLHSGHALGRLLSPFLERLADTADAHAAPLAEKLARGAIDLIAATAAQQLGRPVQDLPGAHNAVLLRVQQYVRWHLADPGLTPAAIARAHGISVRYLHRLFEGEGRTLCQWIRGQRLEECRRALATAPADSVDLGRIARRWGFTSGAQLSRAFRSAYGQSPTDWLLTERHRRATGELR
ncbi:helix-turn-helix domain-containing protein [Kitasatospora sp. NPDC059673]|uniref:AraC-like ligand-binding domain-containing protein n=1 Tax=Kitasatospora sp. NPDC059673 TaxID=3346901 RepID=UPI00369254CC